MKWSETGIHTLREKPQDLTLPGQSLLVRGGFMKKLSQGLFTYGPFLVRSIQKFENIIRQELEKAGAVEILMPMVQPKEIWQKTGRWTLYKDLLQKVKSRAGQEFCLGPTHEEAICDYVKSQINSWRDLPFCLYQIQTKFRDEIRPRFGLLRAKEFIMKDAYSFDPDEQSAKASYQKMRKAYQAIFKRVGASFRAVKADSGEIGGDQSEEFHILAEHGEDELIFTDTFAINREMRPDLKEGMKAPDGSSPLKIARGIEVGHIFYLSDQYSKKMEVRYTSKAGQKQTVKMGCYGIGVTRTVQAVAEQSHDKEGLIWPRSITPFQTHISLLDLQHKETKARGLKLYQELWDKTKQVFLDDRDESPGLKFKDADLLGFPVRITIGKRDGQKGLVELIERKTGKRETLTFEQAKQKILTFKENS